MSILQESNKINDLYTNNFKEFKKYIIPKNINIPDLLETLICNYVNNAPLFEIHKNFKMEYYYPMLEFVVCEINKIYFATPQDEHLINKCDSILSDHLLEKLTILIKGQTLLNKLSHRISKIKSSNNIIDLLLLSARSGPFLTFLFWLNRNNEKIIENLQRTDLETIFILSIGNSDDRLFKYVLEKVLKVDKLFFQKNTEIIINMITTLSYSFVPPKYQLKRLKILSGYISLVPYFYNMITILTSEKVILEIHKYYYSIPHTFSTLIYILRFFVNYNNDSDVNEDQYHTLNHENYNKITNILKTEDELLMLNILLSISYNIIEVDRVKYALISKIITENYIHIINIISWDKIVRKNNNEFVNVVISILVENNLITKYVESKNIKYINSYMLFFTRFLSIESQTDIKNNDDKSITRAIRINKLLHYLRLYVKSKCKTRVIRQKVIIFDLLREISTFNPMLSIPVLKNGSIQYQCQKQKFTNLPPRHLLPGEIYTYKKFLLREKADGVLISNMPNGIYPPTDILSNYQVKAEYIEELDIYLVFDIDIPNSTIIERYNILRNAHPYTAFTKDDNINSLDEFICIFKNERNIIKKFIRENQSEPIKWYPKFACIYQSSNSKINTELIKYIILEENNLIKETISTSEPFNCDGLILTPLDGSREIKIKPRSMMSIDLLFCEKKWIDRNGHDWSNLIIKPKTDKKDRRIYRCYPTDTFDKFTVGEFRFDKKKPNPYNIVDNIVTIIKHNWSTDTDLTNTYYYNTVKKLTSKSLINMINTQVNNLSKQLANLEPEINKSWLDLGCGSGKLIPLIKKYNPKNYLGLDVDINQLVKGIKFHDDNQNVYIFNPCDLANDWNLTPIKWQQINKNIKYDYIIANFSLMHFCTDKFWTQLNELIHEDTKFMFNVVSPPLETNSWSESDSYLKVESNQTVYKFEWTHDKEKTEPFISEEYLNQIIIKYGWKVLENKRFNSSHKLINFYKWWIIKKC
jgi:hypothetical protein